MTTPAQALIDARISANHFDPSASLDDGEINELIRLATQAPSSFNFQNWKFIAVRSAEAKARLSAVAYGQPKVTAAAVTFIVCGTLAPQKSLAARLAPAVAGGMVDQATSDGWVAMAQGMYGDNDQLQRDEAIRSASLAGMTLMLAAAGLGLASGPMIGFDPAGVAREFGLAATEVPALLIAVGKAAPGNAARKPRRPVGDVLTIV